MRTYHTVGMDFLFRVFSAGMRFVDHSVLKSSGGGVLEKCCSLGFRLFLSEQRD